MAKQNNNSLLESTETFNLPFFSELQLNCYSYFILTATRYKIEYGAKKKFDLEPFEKIIKLFIQNGYNINSLFTHTNDKYIEEKERKTCQITIFHAIFYLMLDERNLKVFNNIDDILYVLVNKCHGNILAKSSNNLNPLEYFLNDINYGSYGIAYKRLSNIPKKLLSFFIGEELVIPSEIYDTVNNLTSIKTTMTIKIIR